MKKKFKRIGIIAVAAIVAAAVVWSALRPLQVEVVSLSPETAVVTFTEQGSYEYGELFAVYPIVAGEVLEVKAGQGDRVSAGDILAVISASDYENQIAQLESGVIGYQGQISNLILSEQQQRDSLSANIAALEGQLSIIEAELSQSRRNADSLAGQIMVQEAIVSTNERSVQYARENTRDARDAGDDEILFAARQAENQARNILAQSELLLEQLLAGEVPEDLYEGQKQAVQSQIAVLKGQMGKSYTGGMQQFYNAQIEAARTAIAQMEEMTGKAEISAPIDGVVSSLPLKDKNVASQSEPAVILGSNPRVEVYVPVREIDGVSLGDTVELILDKRLGEQSISGRVIEIDSEAQIRMSALGVQERKVRVLIEPLEQGLQIGYEADVRFTVYTQENALTVPKTAVFSGEDGSDLVWVIRDGKLARQSVIKGIETRGGYIIDSGLSQGDTVVRDAKNASLTEGKAASGS